MRRTFRTSLIAIGFIAGIDMIAAGPALAQNSQASPPSAQQPHPSSQQENPHLNTTKEQAVKDGLANHPAHSVQGFDGQMGSKLPSSEAAQRLPSDVQDQVPEVSQLLFVKLPDRIVLIDPDSQAVAQIILDPSATTGAAPSSSGTTPASSSGSQSR
jgi:hypothetical protein